MPLDDALKPHPIDLAIGARIRLRRRALKISQVGLAERIGVTFQQVQKYERGANRVSGSTLVTVAKALETTVAWLVGEAARSGDGGEAVLHLLTAPGALDLLESFAAIRRGSARQALITLTREMAQQPGA